MMNLPAVIADGIDPRLAALLADRPAGVRLIFAGPDKIFLDTLREIYGIIFSPPMRSSTSSARTF